MNDRNRIAMTGTDMRRAPAEQASTGVRDSLPLRAVENLFCRRYQASRHASRHLLRVLVERVGW